MRTLSNHARLSVLVLAISGSVLATSGRCANAVEKPAAARPQQPYRPTWDSLTRHPVPDWYRDAKFGIYCHWSAFSVPAFGNEWYSRNMYQKGSPENLHHLKTYGSLATFGYKDFIPLFRAEKFNADQWAELFEKAGAKFAGPVTEHADGFSLWDSRLTKWNAARLGPRRDVVGELEKAIRRHGMKFIATFHHQWLWAWYPTEDKSVDASDPRYAGLYGPPVPASAFAGDVYPRPNKPFCDLWEAKIEEVIDKYHPDLIYFDARANTIDESHRRNFLAYYYDQAYARDQQVIMTYKDKDFAVGSGVVDLERGRMARGMMQPWQTDDSIDWKSWCDIQDPSYKSAKRLIDELVDIVGKNGCLLLNIPPKANGEIPEPVKERLLEMGRWLKLNGEAIYGTRPWLPGEGPTQVTEGHFGEEKIKDFTAQDIRFTSKGSMRYAICLGWPGEKLFIKSLAVHNFSEVGGQNADFALLDSRAKIRLLGSPGELKWKQRNDGVTVFFPQEKPCQYAYVLKISRQ